MQGAGNSFDSIAGIYDNLAWLVYGKSIRLSQEAFLNEINHAHQILIIGGGTGWLLEKVFNRNPNVEITFVEASWKMLEKARTRCSPRMNNRVRFIHGTENALPSQPVYDAVIANFYFDMFESVNLRLVVDKIKRSMRDKSILIATDFTDPRSLWHSLLLRTMYTFFRAVANLQAGTLPPWRDILIESGFVVRAVAGFYNGFIEAGYYSIESAKE
jgi:ubiquinone/menaquinone biosynthesis C-methylase UbiE